MMAMATKTLDDVQVGDTLLWHSSFGRERRIVAVQSVTPTIIRTQHSEYRKKDGQQRGADSWSRSRISIPTEEQILEVTHERLAEELRHVNVWSKLSLEQLQKIHSWLKVEAHDG